jgi:toxin ParE1/3/4
MARSRRLVISDRAEADIEAAYEWLWLRDRRAAEAWMESLQSALSTLTTNPQQYGFAPETGSYPLQLRQLLHGPSRSHRVLFCVRENSVTVVAVRDASQAPLADVE